MIIKREQFLEELTLREQVRKIIKIVKERKARAENADEQQLRMYVRELIKEAGEGEELGEEPQRATGIKVLEEVLDNIVEIFERYYKQLSSNRAQRDSFRSHIINAVENLIAPLRASRGAGGAEGALVAAPPVSEQVEIGVDTGSPQDDPRFLDVRGKNKKPTEEDAAETDKAEFRQGVEGELSDDEEMGAMAAQEAFNGPDTTIKNAYNRVFGEDADLFYDYLITNLKLHFDAFEEELGNPEEPTTDAYEQEVQGGGEEMPPVEAPPMEEIPPPDMGAPVPPPMV